MNYSRNKSVKCVATRLEQLEARCLLVADPVISEFMAVNDGGVVDGDGNASDWIELQNIGDEAIDLNGWFLTDDAANLSKFALPSRTIGPGEFLLVFASAPTDTNGVVVTDYVDADGNPHANFRLSSDGEFLALVQPDGATIANSFTPRYPAQKRGISYGLDAESSAPGYFVSPTPMEVNGTAASGIVADTTFDFDRGFYDAPFEVTIAAATPGATIVYTTDGSAPTLANGTIINPLNDSTAPVALVHVATTMTLRAVATKADYISSNVDTQTYIFLQDVIRQPKEPDGLPDRWNGISQSTIRADYEMDPDVVDDPAYIDNLLQGLRDIPTMSIVLDPEDMFGQETGIYINSGQRGREWERPTSIEIIEPDGTSFQVDTGIRIHGYSWRFHSNTPKHSFRLEFRDEYGPSKLEYPLFSDAPVDRFDSIVLRAQGGRAWAGSQNPAEAQYQRDTFARDLSRELGRVDGHATHVHLYINGLYWGLYNPVERPDAQMGEEYFGGDQEDYDALNRRTSSMEVIDGSLQRYNRMTRIVNRSLRSGETTDEDYAELQRYVAIDEFIDFMIVNQYVTNRDGVSAFEGNNQRAIGSRVGDAQFRFFVWDMEYSMWNATDNNNVNRNRPALAGSNNPANGTWAIYNALRQHPEFRLRYADRVQMHFFNDGALTPENAAATWMERANMIENAIVAESARWGDAKRSRPYTRDVEWRREQTRLLETYFPRRSEILVGHLQEVDLYTSTPVPQFQVNDADQHGGHVASGDTLGLIQSGDLAAQTKVLITDESIVSAHVPASDHLGSEWQTTLFVEGANGESWITGPNGVGFDVAANYDRKINIDIGETRRDNASVYVRIPFRIDDIGTLSAIDRLKLQMLVDDGVVAYLNGTEVASLFAPETPTWNSSATGAAEADLNAPIEIDISSFVDRLVVGENMLALHGMNFGTNSGDMIMHAQLIAEGTSADQIWFTMDGSDPRLPGGRINSPENGGTAELYAGGIGLSATTFVRTRALSFDGAWSAVNEAIFSVDAPIRITELNYHPAPPTAAELALIPDGNSDDFEFVEITNIGQTDINLVGSSFASGIEFAFGDARLGPGERGVVVSNQFAFAVRYGDQIRVLGEYSGQLSNSGERITLQGPLTDLAAEPITIEYDDNQLWPQAADGIGATLEIADPMISPSLINKYYSWHSSSVWHGTPGQTNSEPVGVVINEVMSNGPPGSLDAIELFNAGDGPVDVGGWYLSDSRNDLLKYQMPNGTTIQANGYLVIDEQSFNPTPQNPNGNHFALSSTGDSVWLVVADESDNVTRFVDAVEFGASRVGESFARLPNESGRLFPSDAPSFGEKNISSRRADIVVSEVHFNPGLPSSDAIDILETVSSADLEYIELVNPSNAVVPLSNVRVRGGVDADFSTSHDLQPTETVVVASFDPEAPQNAKRLGAFRAHYKISADVMIVGKFDRRLSNNYDRITIERDTGSGSFVIEDEVVYDTAPPWPASPESVQALHRRSASSYGNIAASWLLETPTPGKASFVDGIFGDLNNDSLVNAADIDMLCRNLESEDLAFDLNQDGDVSIADHDYLIRSLLGSIYGDANLDGVFNSSDLVFVFQSRGYEDELENNSGWTSGDWNCDGDFTTRDLVVAFQSGRYVAASTKIRG